MDISSGDGEKGYRLSIFSLDGQKVYETDQLSGGLHDIGTGLKPGVYFVQMNGRSDKTQKLIVR